VRRRPRISATRANGGVTIASAARSSSAKPAGCRVAQLATGIWPSPETQRCCEIVRKARAAQLAKEWKLAGDRVIVKAATQRHAGPLDPDDRICEELLGFEEIVSGLGQFDGLAETPDKAAASNVGMQGPHEERRPLQRYAGRNQPAAQLFHQRLRRGRVVRPFD
jgi:hypothetical protein